MTTISAAAIIITAANITLGDILLSTTISRPKYYYRGCFFIDTLTEAVYYILLSLQEPMHGYGIMQNVEQFSNGRLRLAAGTLYGALGTMLDRGWISEVSKEMSSRKKEYKITDTGQEVLKEEIKRLEELLTNGKQLLGRK